MAKPGKTKLSRKQLKQPDEFQTKGERILEGVVENKNKYLVVIAILIGISLLAFGANVYLGMQADKISLAFADAMAVYDAPVIAADEFEKMPSDQQPKRHFETDEKKYQASITAFDNFLKDNRTSNLGTLAIFHRANCQFKLQNWDKAIEGYNEFLKAGSLGEFEFLAHHNLGQAYDSKGDFDKALEHYSKIADDEKSVMQEHGKFLVAHILFRKGEKDKAKAAFEKFIEEYPESSYKGKAERRLQALKS